MLCSKVTMSLSSSLQLVVAGRGLGLSPLLSSIQSQRLLSAGAITSLQQCTNVRRNAIPACGLQQLPPGTQHVRSTVPAAAVGVAASQRVAGAEGAESHLHNTDGGGGWASLLGFAAAAAMAAAGAGVAADAPADDKTRQAALSSAELAVSEAFHEVLQDWNRAAAQHQQQQQPGAQSSSIQPAGSSQPQQPQVQMDGHFLTVTIPLVSNADVRQLLRLIDQSLDQLALQGSSSSSQQQQTRLLGTSKVVQWDISRTLKSPPTVKQNKGVHSSHSSSSSREQLKVQVVLPLQPGGSPHESITGSSSSSSSSSGAGADKPQSSADEPGSASHGYVSVVKPSGAFTSDELALLARLVAAANKQQTGTSSSYYNEDSWLGPFGLPGSSSSSTGGLGLPDFHSGPFGGAFGGLADNMLNKVFGSLVNDIFDELDIDIHDSQNWQQQLQQQLQGMEQQLRDSVPPEVITWLQDFQRQQQQQQQGGQLPDGSAADGTAAATAAGKSSPGTPQQQQQQQQQLPWQTQAATSAAQQLQKLGAQVYFPAATSLAQQQQQQQQQDGDGVQADEGWGALAGYEEQKQALEDFLLLPLKHPEVFDRVASRTRKLKSSGGSRPRAVLFEGPPGTGKTSSARLLSRRAALPLVYVPLEALVSKWFGESEQNLAKLFKACEALGGCIIFLDELDSLATSRDRSDMHEASRRLLGVLLREIDGFDNTLGSDSSSSSGSSAETGGKVSSSSSRRSVLIGATNRRQDLDAALLSRFDLSIHFGLPDEQCRAAILHQYANHLESQELLRIAEKTAGFSGRDLRDICEQTERQWASKIIRGEVDPEQLPGIQDYLVNVRQRKEGAGARSRGGGREFPWLSGGPGMSGQYRT